MGYKVFTINGKQLGHGHPIQVKYGERVLFHIVNGSGSEIRSLALPGHSFKVIELDGVPGATLGGGTGIVDGYGGTHFSHR